MLPNAKDAKQIANNQYGKNYNKDLNILIKNLNNAIQNSQDHIIFLKSQYNKDATNTFLNKVRELGYTIEETNGETFNMIEYGVYKVKW